MGDNEKRSIADDGCGSDSNSSSTTSPPHPTEKKVCYKIIIIIMATLPHSEIYTSKKLSPSVYNISAFVIIIMLFTTVSVV